MITSGFSGLSEKRYGEVNQIVNYVGALLPRTRARIAAGSKGRLLFRVVHRPLVKGHIYTLLNP
jgi:hypothetical protein